LSRKIVPAIMLSLLIVSMLTLAFKTQIVRADVGTIYINADGSMTPSTAPIYTADNITYTLTGNLYITANAAGIMIDRGDIVLDGAGYTVTGNGTTNEGIILGAMNVTVNKLSVTNCVDGIVIADTGNNTLSGNNVNANIDEDGIDISAYSSNNTISENNITNNLLGIYLAFYCSGNSIIGNSVTANN